MRRLIEYDEVWENRHNNNGKCVECGKTLTGRAQLYCSGECERAFYNKHVKLWTVIREQVFKRDGYICQECGAEVSSYGPLEKRAECDHIVPVSLDGAEFDKSNLQTLCHECHAKKTGRDRGPFKNVYKDVHLGTQKQLA